MSQVNEIDQIVIYKKKCAPLTKLSRAMFLPTNCDILGLKKRTQIFNLPSFILLAKASELNPANTTLQLKKSIN